MKKRRLAALFLAMMVLLGGLEAFATEAPIEQVIAQGESAAEEIEEAEKIKKEKVKKIEEEKPAKSKKAEDPEEETEAKVIEEESEEEGKNEKEGAKNPETENIKEVKEKTERRITKEEIEAKKEERKAKSIEAKTFMKELKKNFGKADNEAKKAILSEIAALKKELKSCSIGVFIKGLDVDFEKYDGVEPEISEERTLVPLRAVSESFEAAVEWNEEERKITITKEETVIELTIGNKNGYINGEEVKLDAAPHIIKDRTLVPLRFIAEAFGLEASWDEESLTVIIE